MEELGILFVAKESEEGGVLAGLKVASGLYRGGAEVLSGARRRRENDAGRFLRVAALTARGSMACRQREQAEMMVVAGGRWTFGALSLHCRSTVLMN